MWLLLFDVCCDFGLAFVGAHRLLTYYNGQLPKQGPRLRGGSAAQPDLKGRRANHVFVECLTNFVRSQSFFNSFISQILSFLLF